MPIPAPAQTFRCTQCGWKKTTVPSSDVLMLDLDWFSRCPKCHNTKLQLKRATPLEASIARVTKIFS